MPEVATSLAALMPALAAHHGVCTVDFETKSQLDVRKVGTVRYAQHHTTRIMCLGYHLPGQKRKLWTPAMGPFPQEIIDFIEAGGTMEAHNAMFECAIWLYILKKQMGIVMPRRWKDTMAACAYRALPMALDEIGHVLNLKTKKDKHGKYLLEKLSKPRKPRKAEIKKWQLDHGSDPMPLLWNDGLSPIPEDWLVNTEIPCPKNWTKETTLLEALHDYCLIDVATEENLSSVVGDLPVDEYKLWVLDQKINWRGVQLDLDAVNAALEVVAKIEDGLNSELAYISDWQVTKGTQVAKLKVWALSQLAPDLMPMIQTADGVKARNAAISYCLEILRDRTGINLLTLTKDSVDEALSAGDDDEAGEIDESEPSEDGDEDYEEASDLDAGVAPEIAASTPWQNVKRALQIRQQTSRASTKKLKKMLECVCEDGRLRGLLAYFGAGTGRWAGRLAQPHNLPRGNLKISSKSKFKDAIEALIEVIKTKDPDLITLYYGDPMEAVSSALRGMFIAGPGKTLRVADFSAIEARVTMWLAGCEEAMIDFGKADRKEGPDIYCVMAQKLYNKPINKKDNPEERQLGKITILGCGYQMGPEKLKFQAKKDYKVDLTDEQAEFLVNGYRESYPEVVALWRGLERAAINAVEDPGVPYSYSAITYCTVDDDAGHWLTATLPNGRKLWYNEPDVTTVRLTSRAGEPYDKKQLGYHGRDNKKGGIWSYIRTYGGMLTENVVQAISRDIMAEAMVRVEVKGYPIILTIHDEIVAETDPDFGTAKEFNALMSDIPAWLPGCPINVEGWTGPRYHKE